SGSAPIVQVYESGVGSGPPPLTARTWNVWLPTARPLKLTPLAHEPNAAASSAHSNVAPVGVDVKVKLALVLVVEAAGVDVSVVSGGAVRIDHVNEAGDESVPVALTARTWNVWLPTASDAYACGDVHAAKAPPSIEHWKVAPVGDEVKLKLALVLVVENAGA